MIHFGLKRLTYIVKFDSSCYYPITFEEKKTKVLFGMSYGLFNVNSIGVAWRPSERLEQIDLFSHVNSNGTNLISYIGTIDANKNYPIKIKHEEKYNMYWIRVLDADRVHISYSSDFKYPMFKFGYIVTKKQDNKIFLKRNRVI